MNKTVVFVHSYCLNGSEANKRLRLTSMASEAMRVGIETMKTANATHILVSAAYNNTWREEFRLQKESAVKSGVRDDQIRPIAPITSSYDEASMAINEAIALGAEKIVVVAEKRHARRSSMILHAIRGQIELEMVAFESPRFEVTAEPSMIKSIRAGFKTTWIIWNKLFEILTPLILMVKN